MRPLENSLASSLKPASSFQTLPHWKTQMIRLSLGFPWLVSMVQTLPWGRLLLLYWMQYIAIWLPCPNYDSEAVQPAIVINHGLF